MRIKAEIWAKAYIRSCSSNGAPAVMLRRGQSDGGAIFIKINCLDGTVSLYGPAPAGMDAASNDRCWMRALGEGAVSDMDADNYLRRQADFDPDIWIIEVEDREGRHFLGDALLED
jgi:hypothetical protein